MSNTNGFFILFIKLCINIIKQRLVIIRLSNTAYSHVCTLIWTNKFKLNLCSLKLIKIKYLNNLMILIEKCNYVYQKLTYNFVVLPIYI